MCKPSKCNGFAGTPPPVAPSTVVFNGSAIRFFRRYPKTTQGALSILNGFFGFLYRRPTAILRWSTGMESGDIVPREFRSENTDAGLYNLTPWRDLVQNIRGRKCDLCRSTPETFIRHTWAAIVKIIRTDKMTRMRVCMSICEVG